MLLSNQKLLGDKNQLCGYLIEGVHSSNFFCQECFAEVSRDAKSLVSSLLNPVTVKRSGTRAFRSCTERLR